MVCLRARSSGDGSAGAMALINGRNTAFISPQRGVRTVFPSPGCAARLDPSLQIIVVLVIWR